MYPSVTLLWMVFAWCMNVVLSVWMYNCLYECTIVCMNVLLFVHMHYCMVPHWCYSAFYLGSQTFMDDNVSVMTFLQSTDTLLQCEDQLPSPHMSLCYRREGESFVFICHGSVRRQLLPIVTLPKKGKWIIQYCSIIVLFVALSVINPNLQISSFSLAIWRVLFLFIVSPAACGRLTAECKAGDTNTEVLITQHGEKSNMDSIY